MPDISNRPNLIGKTQPQVEKYQNPIEVGYGKSFIKFNIEQGFSTSKITFNPDGYIHKSLNFENRKLTPVQRKSFINAIVKFSNMTWGQSSSVQKEHSTLKYRWVNANSLRCTQPTEVSKLNIPYFICFKYNGQENVFGGFFDEGMHKIVWIGQTATDIYKH